MNEVDTLSDQEKTVTPPADTGLWMLVQYVNSLGRVGRGASRGGGAAAAEPPTVFQLPAGLPGASVLDLLSDWDTVRRQLEAFSPDEATAVPGATLVAPLRPGVVLGAGANYYSHCAEMGIGVPDPNAAPFFFSKPPSTTVIGPTADIPYPRDPATKLDWEAELGVVIAIEARNVAPDDARRHIAGYVVVNDLSARDRTARADAVSPHFVYDWLGHKGQDGFCPMGPGITPSWLVSDPQQLRIRLWVNGELKQDAKTDDMVISVDRLVSAASQTMTLRPGDLILTGTPAGVGVPHGQFLHPGDTVTVTIDGLGTISNRVVAA